MAGLYSKKSEKLEDDIWTDIEEPPVDRTSMSDYAVIFRGSSHYYFGGSSGGNLNTILRLQSGSWTWSNIGRIKSARDGHAVISIGEKFMVVGGFGRYNNEACVLKNGRFSCKVLSSSLYYYAFYPILFSVADTYGSC